VEADLGGHFGGRLAGDEEFEGALLSGAQFCWLASHSTS
jgi:hypothetical protein